MKKYGSKNRQQHDNSTNPPSFPTTCEVQLNETSSTNRTVRRRFLAYPTLPFQNDFSLSGNLACLFKLSLILQSSSPSGLTTLPLSLVELYGDWLCVTRHFGAVISAKVCIVEFNVFCSDVGFFCLLFLVRLNLNIRESIVHATSQFLMKKTVIRFHFELFMMPKMFYNIKLS